MTQREKLIAKMRARPVEARVEDVRTVLEAFGWRVTIKGTQHVTYRKEGERNIVLPIVGGQTVKRVYLDKICIQLGLDE